MRGKCENVLMGECANGRMMRDAYMIRKCENTLLKQRCENLCTTLQLKSQQEKATICTFAHSHICTLTTHLHINHAFAH